MLSVKVVKNQKLKTEVDEIIFGQVLTGGAGQNPARQAAMNSGIQKKNLLI